MGKKSGPPKNKLQGAQHKRRGRTARRERIRRVKERGKSRDKSTSTGARPNGLAGK